MQYFSLPIDSQTRVGTILWAVKIAARQIVLQARRIDIGVKMNYAKSFLELGYVPTLFFNDYLKHINSFNSFAENNPTKKGPEDFIKSFNSLIENIREQGYDHTREPILLSSTGEIINGAHRVAISAILNLDITVQNTNYSDELYDYKYFQKKGIDNEILNRSVLSSLYMGKELKLLILWPITSHFNDDAIDKIVNASGTVFFKKQVESNLNLIFNIKLLNYYFHQDFENRLWTGNVTNYFDGVRDHTAHSAGNGAIRFYYIQNLSMEKLTKLKDELRNEIQLGNFAVHTTDSIEETKEITQIISHEASLECAKQNNFKKFPEIVDWLDQLDLEIKLKSQDKEKFVIGGSGPLGAHGSRKISDIDILEDFGFRYRSNLSFVSNHNMHEMRYDSKLSEILVDPSKHFFFLGFKFISLTELKKMKLLRSEKPKDFKDLKLITKLQGTSLKNRKHIGLKNFMYLEIYWKISYQMSLFLKKFKLFLIRFRIIQFLHKNYKF